MNHNPYKRQGQMDYLQSYFYTDTIIGHKHLLQDDGFKMIVVDSWKYLIAQVKIKIYDYVIIPNHIHLLWQMLALNGKESPAGSFAKFTAHFSYATSGKGRDVAAKEEYPWSSTKFYELGIDEFGIVTDYRD
ncbi:hypothetical protein ACFOWM_13505 [Ferruginibacter yonginensis]|uniref:Transposase IS200-like domain-containing protein n=1 Tax=Ferruginibacter yonginensis TaxID=1310416 RepID=A0ABV8QUU2_9BACT